MRQRYEKRIVRRLTYEHVFQADARSATHTYSRPNIKSYTMTQRYILTYVFKMAVQPKP